MDKIDESGGATAFAAEMSEIDDVSSETSVEMSVETSVEKSVETLVETSAARIDERLAARGVPYAEGDARCRVVAVLQRRSVDRRRERGVEHRKHQGHRNRRSQELRDRRCKGARGRQRMWPENMLGEPISRG
jgi:hypothetical protein